MEKNCALFLLLGAAFFVHAAEFSTEHATLKLDEKGQTASLLSKQDGHELIKSPAPFVILRLQNGKTLAPQSAKQEGGAMVFSFPENAGEVKIGVEAHKGFFSFTVLSVSVKDVKVVQFCRLQAACKKYAGTVANAYSDDENGFCVRACNREVQMILSGTLLAAETSTRFGLTGFRAGLAAGVKKSLPLMLREMVEWSGMTYTKLGGPWSLGAEANRGSYLFADVSVDSVDAWIDLARRGGFETVHYSGWSKCLGHYEPNGHFPKGLEDMKATADRIHAAGLRTGMHTLTSGISPVDTWIASPENTNLMALATYTLAKDFSPTDTVLYVKEKPVPSHDVVFTYFSNGNAIRIGTEIIQYTEILRDDPARYGFANCTHGRFGTKAAAHAAGEQADYLWQHFIEFFPKAESSLMDKVADAIANVYNTCGMNGIYLDGLDGVHDWYDSGLVAEKIISRLHGAPLMENSSWIKPGWWFHSRYGAWDHPVWAAKRFHDRHVGAGATFRACDMQEPQMGWWAPRVATSVARGHFLDEMEYFACKNLGIDAAMSIQGFSVTSAPLPFGIERQMTVLGWYEHLRLARYFTPETIARLAVPREEFRLRQIADGDWRFTPVSMEEHRISSRSAGSENWKRANPYSRQPLSARVEALYSSAEYDNAKACSLLGADDFPTMKKEQSADVTLNATTGSDPEHGQVLLLAAENKGASKDRAWARMRLEIAGPMYRNVKGNAAMGFWVKGDGSGAWLDVRPWSPREFMDSESDHLVRLDFTGWRYVELLVRERDVGEMDKHTWDQCLGLYLSFRQTLNLEHISRVDVCVCDIPTNGKASVAITPIRMVPAMQAELVNPALSVNGHSVTMPFTLRSGDYAELEADGTCFHYRETGDLLAKAQLANVPALEAGENALSFHCENPSKNLSSRAEVTVNAFGEPFGARNAAEKINWTKLLCEYDMPEAVIKTDAAANTHDVIVRQGAPAKLEIILTGAMKDPVLTLEGKNFSFPVKLEKSQTLVCRDLRTWRWLKPNGSLIQEGSLPEPLPTLAPGVHKIALSCSETANGRFAWVKHYEESDLRKIK